MFYTILDGKFYCSSESREGLSYYEPYVYEVEGTVDEYYKGYFYYQNNRLIRKSKKEIKIIERNIMKEKIKRCLSSKKYLIKNLLNVIWTLISKISIYIMIIFLSLISIYFAYKFFPKGRDWIDFITAISPLFTFITAFIAIIYSYKSIKSQREQWLKDVFQKRESEILIQLRDYFYDSKDDARKFLTITREQSFKEKPSEIMICVQINELKNTYDKLNLINKLFNREQMLFKKYKIDKYMKFNIEILESINWFLRNNKVNIRYVTVRGDIHGETYELKEFYCMFNSFLYGSSFLNNKDFGQYFYSIQIMTKPEKDKIINTNRGIVLTEMIKFEFELDKLTNDFDSSLPDKSKFKVMRYFQDSDKVS